MFKKLPCRSLSDHTTSGDVNNQMVNPYKPLLDFILAHAQNDERPFLEVSIFDKSIFGLLDSGASNTIAGQLGCEMVFELDQSQHLALEKLLNESFPASKEGELGCTNLIEYEIKVTGSPIKQRYYPLSPAMQKVVNNELDEMLRLGVIQKSNSAWSSPILMVQKVVNNELDEMLRLGVIQKSNSAWSSPILMVPKKDGSLRFCVDFRKINQVIEKDAYPLP
ncbi:hypothetical protein QE152_g14146 [Popillia japonica]|uniref:Uncharacterized protein n=1 Tax=Popillia japonica TaxID=7064 RepID=A0AAW1LAA9_POPJA